MKVLFDHQIFSKQKYGGISRYFANVIDEIAQTLEIDFELGLLITENQYLKNQGLDSNNTFSSWLSKAVNVKYKYLLNEKYCNHLISKNNFDLFHPTYYDPYFIKQVKKPVVITVHDMTYEKLPEYFWAEDSLTYQKRLNIERADKIIAISNTTKNDLLKYFDIDENKITVVYHGIDIETPYVVKAIKDIPKRYLLFVGDRSGYKNFYLFINAFKVLSKEYDDLNVVLTGGGNMGISDVEYIHKLQLQNKIFHYNVTDEELNFLYQNAKIFIYPSLNEGFGLPILEAFKAKCPMILSDIECFREIAGNAVMFFNPTEVEGLNAQIRILLEDNDLRVDFIKKGLKRLNSFPIKKSNQETLNVYKSVL